MKNKIFVLIGFLLTTFFSYAQNEVDILRYSNTFMGGSARYMGMSGAFTALGGDLSTLATNPAGLGVYKKSEVLFTPTIFVANNESNYLAGETMQGDQRYNFNFNNIGIIASYDLGNEDGFCNVNFGFGYNKKQNFNNDYSFKGRNTNTSLLDGLAENVNNDYISIYEDLALDGGLLFNNYEGDPLEKYYNDFSYNDEIAEVRIPYDLYQSKSVSTKGSLGEIDFSMGVNYSHLIYFGFTIAIENLRYVENFTYREYETESTEIPIFEDYKIEQELEVTGRGASFKFGMLATPINWLRIGAAFHTPVFYSLHDNYSYTIDSHFENADYNASSVINGEYDYKLQTPMKMLGGIAFVLDKYAIISADYEYIDYTSGQLNSETNTDEFDDANQSAKDNFTQAHNFKVGAEYRYGPFSIRGGAAVYGSPYKDITNRLDGVTKSYSGGFGIKGDVAYFDLGVVYSEVGETFYMYNVDNIENLTRGDLTSNKMRVLFTVGLKF